MSDGGYAIGEEVANWKMIIQSSGGSLVEQVAVWLTALVDSVVVEVMVSIDIMGIFWHGNSPFKFITTGGRIL